MRFSPAVNIVDVATWIAAAVAVIAALAAGWLAWSARRAAGSSAERATRIRTWAAAVEEGAERAERGAKSADTQAARAWEQVKLASKQLDEARQETRTRDHIDQWEQAHALTMAARRLVETTHEMVNIAADTHAAPEYRLAGEPRYRDAVLRWQETLVKSLARTPPSPEVHDPLVSFVTVHSRLHGQLGALVHGVSSQTLRQGDPLVQQVIGLRQEFEEAHRQFQRAVGQSLVTQNPEAGTRQIESIPASQGAVPARRNRQISNT